MHLPMHANESIAKKTGVLARTNNSRRQVGGIEFTKGKNLDFGMYFCFLQRFFLV